jgi:hypothetical protein
LLVYQADYVLDTSDPTEIHKRLHSLPKDLDSAYNAIFDRMNSGDLAFAYRILGWMVHAQRPMSMSELSLALAINISEPSLHDYLIPNASEVVRASGGLIIHNESTDLVLFNHETVRPFLQTNKLASTPFTIRHLQNPPDMPSN